MKLSLVRVAPAALVLVSCVHASGRLESNRFQHERYPYAVFYAPGGAPMTPLGARWRVDNLTAEGPDGNRHEAKNGDGYRVTRAYDLDDNGKVDLHKEEPFYDLLLEHNQTDAAMWVRTVPISVHDKDKALRVLAERYVEAVAGAGAVSVHFGSEGATGTIERRFASRVLDSRDCALSKREAHRIDFEVANVDQLQLSDNARWLRGSLVLIRTGYVEPQHSSNKRLSADYPVLMLIGLSATPSDYATVAPDFELLLQKTVLGDVGGGLAMHGETTCGDTPTTSGSMDSPPETVQPAAPAADPESPESLLAPMPPEEAPAPTTP